MDQIYEAGAVAWYGATVATITFLFNVCKWTFERARLRVRIVPTIYEDGGFEKVEQTQHLGTSARRSRGSWLARCIARGLARATRRLASISAPASTRSALSGRSRA